MKAKNKLSKSSEKKSKQVSISDKQALNIRAILINCQRMVEGFHDGQDDFTPDIETIEQTLADLGELGKLPKELNIPNSEGE